MLTEYSSSFSILIPLIKEGRKRSFFFYKEKKDVLFDSSSRKEKRIFKRIIRDSIQNIHSFVSVQDLVSLPLTRFIISSSSSPPPPPPPPPQHNNNKYLPPKLFLPPQQFHLYPSSVPLLSNLHICSCSASGSSMALKAVHVTDVPNLDQVKDNAAALNLYSDRLSKGVESVRTNFKSPKFLVIGHRGSGMNMLQSSDKRMKAIKENSILSFNNAATFGVDFVEFDVQVTQDDCPIIFHDNFILTKENDGSMLNTRVAELTLAGFLRFGPQRDAGNVGRPLFRRTKDQKQLFEWKVENDDSLCTLQEAFQKVNSSLGFNIELKFDDLIVYEDEQLIHVLQVILGVVFAYAGERPVIFSTFQPDAARLMRRLQDTYPVFFLTNGGSEVYADVRRNSLDEAIKLCLENGLQGIVSEVKALFKNLGAVTRIKEAHLSLLTYGQLNNVSEAVYLQHLMGVEGVIVDFVPEITKTVTELIKPVKEGEEDSAEGQLTVKTKAPKFTQIELMFLQKLISELIQH